MSERLIHVRGIDIHVEMNGDESLPAIVLLHGFTGSTETWNTVLRTFYGELSKVAVDLIGHGKTTAPDGCITLFHGATTR